MSDNTYFWAIYGTFISLIVWSFWATDDFDGLTSVGGRVILTMALIVVGLVIKHWVKGGMRF